MHTIAQKTAALNPPHKYVPWVVADGQHTEDINDAVTDNLLKYVCDNFQGEKAAACSALADDHYAYPVEKCVAITPGQAADLVDGFLQGTGCSDKIDACIQNVPQVESDVSAIAEDCGKNLVSIGCVTDLEALVNDIVGAASQCQDAGQDLEKLENILKAFADPLAIVTHLAKDIFHLGKYTDEFKKAQDAWNNQDYKSAGEHIGKLVLMITDVSLAEPELQFLM